MLGCAEVSYSIYHTCTYTSTMKTIFTKSYVVGIRIKVHENLCIANTCMHVLVITDLQGAGANTSPNYVYLLIFLESHQCQHLVTCRKFLTVNCSCCLKNIPYVYSYDS